MKTKIAAIGDVGFQFEFHAAHLEGELPLVCRTFSRCRALWRLFLQYASGSSPAQKAWK